MTSTCRSRDLFVRNKLWETTVSTSADRWPAGGPSRVRTEMAGTPASELQVVIGRLIAPGDEELDTAVPFPLVSLAQIRQLFVTVRPIYDDKHPSVLSVRIPEVAGPFMGRTDAALPDIWNC